MEEIHRLKQRCASLEFKNRSLEQRLEALEDFIKPQIKAVIEQEKHEQKLFEEQMYIKN